MRYGAVVEGRVRRACSRGPLGLLLVRTIPVLIMIVLLGGRCDAGYVAALTGTPGLVSYWGLNEPAGSTLAADAVTSDAIDGNNTGACVGAGITVGDAGPRPAEGWLGFAADNRAVTFTKVPTDKLQMSHVTGYAGLADLTMLGWIRITDSSAAALHNLFGGLQTTEPSRYVFAVDHAPSGLRGVAARAGDDPLLLGPGSVSDLAQWHFVAMTYEGGTTAKLYWDAVEIDGQERSAVLGLSGATALVFGQDISDPTRSLHGQLDELAMFNRALGKTEIERLFVAAQSELPYVPGMTATAPYYQTAVKLGGLRNHWRLGETSGSAAVDAIGGNTGTYFNVVGAPVAIGQPGPSPAVTQGGWPLAGFEPDNAAVRFVWNTGANYLQSQNGAVLGNPTTGLPFASGVKELTMAFWFKGDYDGTAYVAGFAKPGSSNRYVFSAYCLSGSEMRFYTMSSNGVQMVTEDLQIDTPGEHDWHHVAQVWDGDQRRLCVYIDGQERFNGTDPAMTANLYPPSGFHLGRDVYGSTCNLGGFLDEVSLFDRVLSAEEVFELYDSAFFAGSPRVPGDANGDGKVDDLDASILAAHWQKSSGATWEEGDFSGDGRVDDLDASVLAANWQYGVGAAVPEPQQSLALLAAALALWAIPRRRGFSLRSE